MIMLEPSLDNPMNIEAYSYFISNPELFDHNTQKSIMGDCILSGIQFYSVISNIAGDSGRSNDDLDRMDLSSNNSNNGNDQKQYIKNKRKIESDTGMSNSNYRWEEREESIR